MTKDKEEAVKVNFIDGDKPGSKGLVMDDNG